MCKRFDESGGFAGVGGALPARRGEFERVSLADPRPHIPALDGIRGLAVLLVVASHAMRLVPRSSGLDHTAWQVLATGWIGVDLFFVLSGFLITGILYDAKGDTSGRYFGNFYARRVLRIAPLYYGFLAFYFYVLPRLPLPGGTEQYQIPGEVRPMLWLYLYNFWGAVHQHMHANLGVFWSLCVEEHFYLVWPFVVWLMGRRALMRLCVVVGLMSLSLRAAVLIMFPNDHAAYLLTPCRLDGLAAGSFVALALRDRADWQRLISLAPRVGLGAAAFLLGMAAGQRHLLDNVDFKGQNLPGVDSSVLLCIGLTALALLFASLVALTVNAASQPHSATQQIFRNPLLRSLGMYSYAIYVLHPLVISLARQGLAAADLEFPSSAAGALACRLAVMPLILGVVFALAWASYHAYEKHFLALKRFFPPARKPAAPTAPAGEIRGDRGEDAGRRLRRDEFAAGASP
jgi:peptidoglycan/LPS O-acetylase OafA/YrhL